VLAVAGISCSRLADVKVLSWCLIIFVSVLNGFAAWVRGNPYDIGGAIGRALPALVIAFLVAYIVRGRKGMWDSFARWYFWTALGLMILSQFPRTVR
jgi:branched-subunit amino acid transport protein AzlD